MINNFKIIYSPLIRNENRMRLFLNKGKSKILYNKVRYFVVCFQILTMSFLKEKCTLYISNDQDPSIKRLILKASNAGLKIIFLQVSLFRYLPSNRQFSSLIDEYFVWKGFEHFVPYSFKYSSISHFLFIEKIDIDISSDMIIFIGQPGKVLSNETFNYYGILYKFLSKYPNMIYIKHPQELEIDLLPIKNKIDTLPNITIGRSVFTFCSSVVLQLPETVEAKMLSLKNKSEDLFSIQNAIKKNHSNVTLINI